MTDYFELRFPNVPWRTPLPTTITDGRKGFLCRLCVAYHGYKPSEPGRLYETAQAVLDHLKEQHPITGDALVYDRQFLPPPNKP